MGLARRHDVGLLFDGTSVSAEAFAAIADPARRSIIEQMTQRGSVTATEIAADLAMSRQAVAKHLGLLERAGLASSQKAGRETRFVPEPHALASVREWVESVERDWQKRLGNLKASLE